PEVIKAMQQGAAQYGAGSGASHLISGHSSAHHALEEELAAFTRRPRALLFSTGYMANLGVVSALAGRGDVVLEDRLNHASLIDAGLLSGARMQRYAHADCNDLARKLATHSGKRALLVSDGVFSMDGDIAPAPELAAAAKKHHAWLMLDDAHGFGVLGQTGGGTQEHFGLTADDVPILVGTLGKAFGTFGAFVAGSEELIETLIQQARSYIYTTALPPAVAEATRMSLRLAQSENWRREKLHTLINRFRSGAARLRLNLMPSETPIQPLLTGDNETTLRISEQLYARGILIGAIRPPTVPKGQARLRITFSATHSEQQVDRLLETLAGLFVR
ncbi:MAG: 8-amino-7-oxononanoate synthase, partial [Gammaproteobacteria bacterium]|nr:8-amino-7-oxononanoate synthase [Gammaproteobacteria bacterium]